MRGIVGAGRSPEPDFRPDRSPGPSQVGATDTNSRGAARVRRIVTGEKVANPFPDGRDDMKRLLGTMIGLGFLLAIASAAHAGGVHVGIYVGGPPVLVPAPPPVV